MELKSLLIEATDETPFVHFDVQKCNLTLTGRSMPENAYRFYGPVIEHIKFYSQHMSRQFKVHIELEYYNSSSGRFLLELLGVLQERFKSATECCIYWHVDNEDELMIQKGEELKELLSLPIELVKK